MVGLSWINLCHVNITAILFVGLLCIVEKTATTFLRILYPLQFPVGLDSTTYIHVHGKWEGRKYSLEADPARHMSRYQLRSLQELQGEPLLSIHVAVWSAEIADDASWESATSVQQAELVIWHFLEVPALYSSSNTSSRDPPPLFWRLWQLPAFPFPMSHNYECL